VSDHLTIITASCGRNDINAEFLKNTIDHCRTPIELIWVVQDSSDVECEWLRDEIMSREIKGMMLRFPEALGPTKAFNEGLKYATGAVVAMLHNDLYVYETAWDQKLLDFFAMTSEAGVVGFAGAKSIGAPELYQAPYQLQQLVRGHVFTSLEDWWHHGYRAEGVVEVVVLDGLALCARRVDLEDWGGLFDGYLHHMYDNDLSLVAIKHGKRNYVLPVVCRHVSGQTANFERYGKVAARVGGDSAVHARSHEVFYERWRGFIPLRIP
jgi:GT2 family glycosyltransferase